MEIVTVTEAKNKLSALLAQVRSGKRFLIVDRGRPVARLESVVGDPGDPGGRLARLQRAGLVSIGEQPAPANLVDEAPPRPDGDVSIVDVLLEERRLGR